MLIWYLVAIGNYRGIFKMNDLQTVLICYDCINTQLETYLSDDEILCETSICQM